MSPSDAIRSFTLGGLDYLVVGDYIIKKNKMVNKYTKALLKVIPGGSHTYSRGSDQYPSNAPSILSKGKGAIF